MSVFDPRAGEVWLVGGGIASMAAAAFLIRDAGMPASHPSVGLAALEAAFG